MGSSRTRLLIVILQLVYLISAQEVVKREPQEFKGMRGKKFTGSESADMERYFKGRPQFFVGVKGKKNLFNLFGPEYVTYKLGPMGFFGIRGMKDFLSPEFPYPEDYSFVPKTAGSLVGRIDYSINEEDSRNVDISVLTKLFDTYLEKNQSSNDMKLVPKIDASTEQLINGVNKRAGNIPQFFGVRGQKSIQMKRLYDLNFRGKFIGVRGKKGVTNTAIQELKDLLNQPLPWPKRKAQMGFFGMRGKKLAKGEQYYRP